MTEPPHCPGKRRATGDTLSPQQVVNRLLLIARRTIRDHAPRGGRCPLCRVPECAARQRAVEFVASHGMPPDPVLRLSRPSRVLCLDCSVATAYRLPRHPRCPPVDGPPGTVCHCPICHPARPAPLGQAPESGGGRPPADEGTHPDMWTRPRRTDDRPPLLEIGRDALGTRYVRRAGQRSNAVVTFSEEEWIELEQAIRHGQYF